MDVPEYPGGLRGRTPVLELVRDCLALPQGADRPVTVLLGPTGIGATDVHAKAKETFAPHHPCAYLNFDAGPELATRSVLGALFLELGRKMVEFDEPNFPRLLVGLIATEQAIEARLRAQARREMPRLVREQLRDGEGRGSAFVTALVETLGGVLGTPPGVSESVSAVLSSTGLRPSRLSRRLIRQGIAWYGDGRVPPCTDPADALVELNSWRHAEGGRQQGPQDVDRILLRAFLADLREHAKGWLHHRSFLLLLDNCHTPSGQRFLELLLEARREDKSARRGCDPLVTLSSTHRWLPDWGPVTGAQWELRPQASDLASLAHWEQHRMGESSNDYWWYPLELSPLRLTDTRELCTQAPSGTDIAPGIQRFTDGLPWAVRHTVTTLLTNDRDEPASPGDDPYRRLRQVPGLRPAPPVPGPDPLAPTLAHASIGFLLEELADETGGRLSALVRWSAARDLSLCGQVFGVDVDDRSEPLLTRLRERWLLAVSEDGRLVLHPWLRRLLLWELAADASNWRRTHGRLSRHFHALTARAPERGAPRDPALDPELEQAYHLLALGLVEPVATLLTRRFTEQSSPEWIRSLDVVTSAPNRLDKSVPPLRLLDSLTSNDHNPATDLRSVIRRLVVARWLWSDPLSDPGRRLNAVLAGNFDQLTVHRSTGLVQLYDEAARYRQWREQ